MTDHVVEDGDGGGLDLILLGVDIEVLGPEDCP